MGHENISQQYDKGISKGYVEGSVERAESDPGRKFLRERVARFPHEARIVDVGCGNGIDLKAYRDMGFIHIEGVEPSDDLREQARQLLGPDIQLIKSGFDHLPQTDASTDVVTARFSLHYTENVEVALQEVARILKPGGAFIGVISHPDADAKVPRNPDGTITITLFERTVPITFPVHSNEEYFGEQFQELFEPNPVIKEYCGEEQDRGVTDPDQPNALCFDATRKST